MRQGEGTVLGIETSCDETAAAVVRREADGRGVILSSVTAAQIEEHAPYGGVVPEIAARAHVERVNGVLDEAMRRARLGFGDIDGFAATAGPGLIGGLLVGLATAKAMALARGKPLLAVNHLEGHALTARLSDGVDFPFLALLISGGHTQLVRVESLGRYRCLGTTLDDAAGEVFDKVAKMLRLEFPGGPALERLAQGGDGTRFALPRPMLGRRGADFSFSGLKTATVRLAQRLLREQGGDVLKGSPARDLAASFQQAVVDCLADRVAAVMEMHAPEGYCRFVLGGGVGSNAVVRKRLGEVSRERGYRLVAPPGWLCVDNGAMIAWAGAERLAQGWCDSLDVPARSRWPLDDLGAKA